MTPRARNNTIAGFIVVTFWLVLVIPTIVQAAVDESAITQTTTSTVTSNGTNETTVYSPPPSAISPNVGGNNSDLCTISSSGALGTQILSLSLGATYTEENCLRLKKAQKLYIFGMKVAAVSVMCQDPDVWQAMMDAGTPCPIDGLIGDQAKAAWEVRTTQIPMPEGEHELTAEDKRNKALSVMGSVAAAFLFF
jgi:hypothetical protein|tara:strand:- start:1194 stop:1775 length:582 start_codon:yes stop_codon:yes gene_type:complete